VWSLNLKGANCYHGPYMCNPSPSKPLQLLSREQPDAPAFMHFHKGSPARATYTSFVLVSLACGPRSRAPVLFLIHASAPRTAPRRRPRAHTGRGDRRPTTPACTDAELSGWARAPPDFIFLPLFSDASAHSLAYLAQPHHHRASMRQWGPSRDAFFLHSGVLD
jgi:hypothetical protein